MGQLSPYAPNPRSQYLPFCEVTRIIRLTSCIVDSVLGSTLCHQVRKSVKYICFIGMGAATQQRMLAYKNLAKP